MCRYQRCVSIPSRSQKRAKNIVVFCPILAAQFIGIKFLLMGIACAPQIWMDYITLILSELEHKAKYIAIMDDLLVHSTKAEHWLLIEQLLQSMVKNGLRLSPKKCQFFKTNLVYMGNEFGHISEKHNSHSIEI